jgi:hypothetical protein
VRVRVSKSMVVEESAMKSISLVVMRHVAQLGAVYSNCLTCESR